MSFDFMDTVIMSLFSVLTGTCSNEAGGTG